MTLRSLVLYVIAKQEFLIAHVKPAVGDYGVRPDLRAGKMLLRLDRDFRAAGLLPLGGVRLEQHDGAVLIRVAVESSVREDKRAIRIQLSTLDPHGLACFEIKAYPTLVFRVAVKMLTDEDRAPLAIAHALV